jgi:hypothetical protein
LDDVTFLARVQAHLDARRDPLDDADVLAFVDAHPERLAELATLRADARELARLPVASRRPAPRFARRYAWLAAGAAAALAAMLLHTSRPTPPAGRIVAASLHEQRPRAHAAATFFVREALVSTATTRWQAWQYRSEPR